MFKISVLVSGKGSTLDNLAFHCFNQLEGMVQGMVEITQVVADRDCPALGIAEHWEIPVKVVEPIDYDDLEEWSKHLLEGDVDLHVMAGFLRKIVVPEHLTGKVVNIHPSLLPAYGGKGMFGMNVHNAVIQNKESFSGCTVHVVDNEYDHGPIVDQIKQAVLPWDDAESLCEAIQAMEKKLYPRAILNYLLAKR